MTHYVPFTLVLKRKKKSALIIATWSLKSYEFGIWKKVELIQVVIGPLGTVWKDFNKWIKKLELDLTVEMLQNPSLFRMTRILRKVLDGNKKKVQPTCITKDHWIWSTTVVNSNLNISSFLRKRWNNNNSNNSNNTNNNNNNGTEETW